MTGLTLGREERGAAIVEMALVLPLLLALLMGVLVYGQYFMFAHNVQQAANDGARASIIGLDAADRRTVALRAVTRSLQAVGGTHSAAVSETSEAITVAVTFTVPQDSFLRSSFCAVARQHHSRPRDLRTAGGLSMAILPFFRRLIGHRGASISITTAFGMTMLIGSAAFAVDLGSLYLDRRKLQGIADAAAMAAAGRPGEERAAAQRIIAANCDCDIRIAAMIPALTPPIRRDRRSNALRAGAHRRTRCASR